MLFSVLLVIGLIGGTANRRKCKSFKKAPTSKRDDSLTAAWT